MSEAGLELVGREGVAVVGIAVLVAPGEPAHPLLGGAVGPGLLVDATRRFLLDPVVADGRRSVEPLLEVAALEDRPLVSGERPDSCEAVGLELLTDRKLVGVVGVRAALSVDVAAYAGHVLNVMRDLVCEHV